MTPDGHVPYRGEELTLIGSYKTRDQAESRAHDVEREHRCAVVDILKPYSIRIAKPTLEDTRNEQADHHR